MTPYEWMQKVAKKHDVTSDYAIAKLLGISRQTVSQHKSGRNSHLDNDTCLKVAELLEIDAITVIADQAAMKTKDSDLRTRWEQLGRIAVCAVAAPFLFSVTTPPANAALPTAESVHYVK